MAIRSRVVTRAPLIRRLGVEPLKRITLVEAPHGYGKTLFLKEWEKTVRQRGVRTALILAEHLIAGERAFIEIGAKTLSLRHSASHIATFEHLLAAIATINQALVLFLDDIEKLEGPVLSRLCLLMDNASDKVRFVLAFAPPCPIAVGRHAVNGQISRVTSEDLLFGLDSSRQFLPDDCTEEDLLELHSLTGGWPLALSVLYGAEDRVDGGAEVLRVMISQLLERQSADVRDFLVTMSITPTFTSQHAALLTGRTDAHLLIGEARRSGFPLIYEAQSDSYRYHGLVRDFLRDTLQKDGTIDLHRVHRRAAHWHMARNEPLEALRHALSAGDPALIDAVTRLQSGYWPMGLINGMSGLKELALLPLVSLAHSPRLWIAAIYALIQNGEIAAADAQMKLLHALCASDEPIFLVERDAMAVLLRHYHDEPILDDEVTPLAERCATIRAPSIIATLVGHNLPMFAAADAANLPRARSFGEAACASYRAEGAILADAYTRLRVGQLALHQGDPAQALAHFRDVHSETTTHLHDSPHQLMSRFFIAEALQFQGQFAKAETSFNPALAVINAMEPWPPLIETYYRVRARAALWNGERGQAVAILEEGLERALRNGATRLFLSFGLARAEIIGSPDMIDHIDGTLRGLRDKPGREGIFSPWLCLQARLARIRLTLAQDPRAAGAELERLAQEAELCGLAIIAHAARLLFGLIHVTSKDRMSDPIDNRFVALQEARLTGVAMEEMWLSGEAIGKLPAGAVALERLASLIAHGDPRLTVPSPDGALPAAVMLSRRERDVLDLMLIGLSGREMASRLDLSESSIKSYRNALYRKFGVQQRSALIATVRAHGLTS